MCTPTTGLHAHQPKRSHLFLRIIHDSQRTPCCQLHIRRTRVRVHQKQMCHHQSPRQHVWRTLDTFGVSHSAATYCPHTVHYILPCCESRRPTLRESFPWPGLLPPWFQLITMVWMSISYSHLGMLWVKRYEHERSVMQNHRRTILLG